MPLNGCFLLFFMLVLFNFHHEARITSCTVRIFSKTLAYLGKNALFCIRIY